MRSIHCPSQQSSLWRLRALLHASIREHNGDCAHHSAHALFLLLPLSNTAATALPADPEHVVRDAEDDAQHTADHDEVEERTATRVVKLSISHSLGPSPLPSVGSLQLTMCSEVALMVEVPNIVLKAAREASWSSACRTLRTTLCLPLCFMAMRSFARMFTPLLTLLTPSSTPVETRWWPTELCSPPTQTTCWPATRVCC